MDLSPTIMLNGLYNKNYLEDFHSLDALKLASYYSEKDNERYLEYLRVLEKQNNPDSLLLLGNYYYRLKNYEKMIKYYQDAVKQGNYYGYYNLGLYYEEVENWKMMIEMYQKATQYKIKEAFVNFSGYYNDRNDLQNTLKYLKLGIELNCEKCMNNYAIYFQMTEDYKNANLWYEKACKNGNLEICLNYIKFLISQNMDYTKLPENYYSHQDFKTLINQILSNNFKREIAIKFIKHIDEQNLTKLFK